MAPHSDSQIIPISSHGPAGWPLLGHLPHYLHDKLGYLSRCVAEHGDVVKLKIGGPTYLLNDPEDIKYVLATNHGNYEKSPRITGEKGRSLFGEGLLTRCTAEHRPQRQMLQPVFHRRYVDTFGDVMVSCTEQMLDTWKCGATVNIVSEMMALSQRIIGKILFDLDFAGDARRLGDAMNARRRYIDYVFSSAFPLPEYWPSRINRDHRCASAFIEQAIDKIVKERRALATSCHEPVHHDMVSLLLQSQSKDGTPISDKEVRAEALELFLAGYETVGHSLAWTCYLLSRDAEVERRFVAELQSVLDGRAPHASDVSDLCYAEMTLAESMRLYPPTWLFVRVARHEDELPSGAVIPAGSKFFFCPFVTHRQERYFPDPERFDPQRFSDEAKRGRPKYAYFPFGGGPRLCIGQALAKMEGVLGLACIFRRFRLELVRGQSITPAPRVTLSPRHGIMMTVHQR